MTQPLSVRQAASTSHGEKQAWLPALRAASITALSHFKPALLRYPLVIVFLLGYAVLRVVLNMMVGASFTNAVRPMLISLFFAAFSIFVIDTLHYLLRAREAPAAEQKSGWAVSRPWAALFLLVLWGFWVLEIIHRLQVAGRIPGAPVLAWLPGWSALTGLFQALGQGLHSLLPVIPAYSAEVLLSSVLLRILLPLGVLLADGLHWRDLRLSFKRWQVAAPFIAIGLLAFVYNGITARGLALLGFGLIYPALTEEFFYRGLLQQSFKSWLRPGYAVLLTALVFGLLHLPDLAFIQYEGMFPLALTNMADKIITGLVWGYGVERTRSVLPWAVYHSVSNAAGL